MKSQYENIHLKTNYQQKQKLEEMRRRRGAMHSDDSESFIQLAIDFQNQELIYYSGKTKGSATCSTKILASFDYAFDNIWQDSSVDTCESNIDREENITVFQEFLIFDSNTLNLQSSVFKLCNLQEETQNVKRVMEYASLTTEDSVYKFWIYNTSLNHLFTPIINQYLQSISSFIIHDGPTYKANYQRIASLKQNQEYTIFRIKTKNEGLEQEMLSDEECHVETIYTETFHEGLNQLLK